MLWTGEYDAEWEKEFSSIVNVKRAGFNYHNTQGFFMDEDELIEQLHGQDIFFVGYDRITKKVLDACPDLKLILSVRDGPEENIDLEACRERGVPVLNSSGRCTVSVAELTINLILNMARPVIYNSSRFRNEKWTDETRVDIRHEMEVRSFELFNKTLGIVGLGRNGQYLAKLAKPFGMRIVAYDPFLPDSVFEQLGVEQMELNEVMKVSDYISILARVTPENHNMIGREQFDLMKPTAAFVNTGRAVLVDTEALKDALRNNRIRMAAIDVFSPEPISSDDTYYDIPADRLILTTHMAGYTNERVWHQYSIGIDNLKKYLTGETIQNSCTRGVEDTDAFKDRGGKLFGINKEG